MSLVLKIKKKVHNNVTMPTKATEGSACFDLYADIPEATWVTVNTPVVIPTGIIFEVPKGYALMLYSRSGHGFKHDLRLANSVGVLDSDFRGEAKVKLTADGNPYLVTPGERIAQAMLIPIPEFIIKEVDELSETERGAGGFGSSGK